MIYALISDLHANLTALKAVVHDAKAEGATHFLFLGDYCLGPKPNETLDFIRNLDQARFVSGNEDDFIVALQKKDPASMTDGQFSACYWCYEQLTNENISFLSSIPNKLKIQENGLPPIFLFHKPEDLFNNTAATQLNPRIFAKEIDQNTFTTESFPAYAKNLVTNDSAIEKALLDLQDGVYAFGHKHIQWNVQLGGKHLVNAGSAGLPLDFLTTAAYTLLIPDHGRWSIKQKRVDYGLSKAIGELQLSAYRQQVPVWSGVIQKELETAREHALLFLEFTESYAGLIGDTMRPYSHKVWSASFAEWIQQFSR